MTKQQIQIDESVFRAVSKKIVKHNFVMGNFYKYIFVSHSSKDWEKVRIIRNYIENLKFYPLLFHLKCLEKDPLLHKDVIRLKRILKEEIASRGRFLLCNSENSKKSEFVNWEIREVKKYSNIIVEEINIDDPGDFGAKAPRKPMIISEHCHPKRTRL